MRSGFVSLIGRPNVGKSTLLNSIVGKKVAITSNKPQTTRNIIQGIYNDDDTQIVFVDTPGIHKPNHKLGIYLNKQAYYSIDDVDIVLMLVDASMSLGGGDRFIVDRLKEVNKPVILIINKIDKITSDELLEKINEYKDIYPFSEIIPVSALKNNNVKTVVEVLRKYLPDEVQFYDKNDITNKSIEFVIAEIIREKVFELTDDEVPHSITCYIEHTEQNKNKSYILNGVIVVDRDSLKRIIIGKQGQKLKEIGTRARKDIEELLGQKVYLQLYVKTIKKWRDKESTLAEFGFTDFDK